MATKSTILMMLLCTMFAGVLQAQVFPSDAGTQFRTTLTLDAVSADHVDYMIIDLSQLGWLEAFDSLHQFLSYRYAFTEWKEIDWEQKKSHSRPKIEQAQSEINLIDYTEALFEYILSVPDGHMIMIDIVGEFSRAKQAGSYGLNMIPLSDGSIVVNIVPEWGPAYLAGLRCGDEILEWNNVPVPDVPQMEVYNNQNGQSANYATEEGRMISRYEVLSRDPVGAVSEITYRSYETGSQETITLTAVSDTFSLFQEAFRLTVPDQGTTEKVVYKILDGDIGYLHVADEGAPDTLTLDEIRQTEIYLKVQEAITHFNQQNIDKLVFDLRENHGGNDLLGATIAGFFIDSSMFYEYITGSADENFAIIDSIITVPESPGFAGEIVVMVGPKNISTGEGMPMILQRLPNAKIVSFWGTNGSFGIVPDVVIMPDSLQFILSPYSRSLNENKEIQLDSDADMVGGVQPDIRIPLTVERVIEQWHEGKDVELEYAISILLDIPEITLQQEYKIYPNPADHLFHVTYDSKKPVTVRITDLSGRLVKCARQVISGQPIDVSSLPPGLYFIGIDANQQSVVGKLLIQ